MKLFDVTIVGSRIRFFILGKRIISFKFPAFKSPEPETEPASQEEQKYTPVNFRKRDLSNLEEDIDHAFTVLKNYQMAFDKFNLDPNGLNIVEIGPGIDFAVQLILASMGAKISLCDLFLSPFDPEYHPILYSEIAKRYDGPKEQLIAGMQGYENTTLKLISEPAETLISIPDNSADLVFSRAVLEHVADMSKVAKELARITKPEGFGYHLIDMRDHRDFKRPLDHLAMDEEEYHKIATYLDYEFGNRLRKSEFIKYFEQENFELVDYINIEEPTCEYFDEIIPKIKSANSIYNNYSEDDLKDVFGRFFIRKKS